MNQQVMELLVTMKNDTAAGFASLESRIAAVNAQAANMNGKMVTGSAAADAATTKHSSSYLRLGVAIVAATTLVDALGVKSATALDTAEHHVMALTDAIGNGVNQIPLPKLEAEIRSLSDQTGKSTTELTQGFYQVASVGLDAARTTEILAQGSKFAAASQTDEAVALRLLTGVTQAYHLSLDQIKPAQDDITQAIKIGRMEAPEYVNALSQIVPTAARLGIGLKELGAMFATLTNDGISAAESGVYLQNVLNRLLNPTFQQIRAIQTLHGTMADFKVVNGDVAGTLEHLNALIVKQVPDIRVLENAHGDLTARSAIFAEQMKNTNSEVAKLFGGNTDAMKAFFALMANGEANLHANLGKMQGDAGATDAAFTKMSDSAAMGFKRFAVQADQLTQAIGKDLLPQLEGFAKVAGPIASGTGDIIRQNQILGTVLADTGVALASVVGGYYAWQFIGAPMVSAIGAITTAIEGSTVAMAALDVALSPEGALLAAFALGTVEAYQHIPEFRHFIDDLAGSFTQVLPDAVVVAQASLKNIEQALHDVETTFQHVANLDWAGLFKKGAGLPNGGVSAPGTLGQIGNGLFGPQGLQLPGGADAIKQFLATINPAVPAVTQFVGVLHNEADAQRQAAYQAREHTKAINDQIAAMAGGLTGSGLPKLFPDTSFGGTAGKSASTAGADPFDVASTIKTAEQNIGIYSKAVIDDAKNFGEHSKQVASDRANLAANIATYTKYNDQLTALANTTGKLKDVQTQAEKDYAAAQQKYQDALVQGAVDVATFGHVLPAHAKALDDAKTKALAMSNALSTLEGKTTHTASALDILNKAALKGEDLPALYDAAAEAQKKLADKSTKLADVFAEVERRAGDYSAYLSQFQKKLQDQLTSAEGRLAFDQGPKGDHSRIGADKDAITAAQKNLDTWSASVSDATGKAKGFSYTLQVETTKLQNALSAAEGKLIADQNNHASAGTIASDKKAVTAASNNLNTFNKELSDLTPSFKSVESAAQKAAAALQKIEDRLSKPGAEGAESANRVGQFNARNGSRGGIPNPSDYSTESAWEAAQTAYFKKHAEDFYHNNPSAVSSLIGRPGEMKIEGITPAQLLADPAVKKYLETLTEKKLKELGFSPSQLAQIPGTAEWQKKQPIDNSTVAQLPGARFGQSGLAGPTVPSINSLGGGFAATVPGIIAGGKALENSFANLVKAGDDAAKASELQTHVAYQVAKDTGDTATQFSILDTAFLAGKKAIDGMPVTIEGVVAAYNANQATVLQSTRNLIEFDQRTGNTADALAQTQTLYLQGNASLAQLDQAYNDNQVSVRKATDANNAFYASTGQFGQLLSSITSQITQGVTDSQAKVTLDAYTGNSAAIAADTQSAIAHREAQEKLTAATWDATYATANASTQSQMRQSLASPMVSQQSTVQGLASGVFNAQLGVIAAQSAVEVSLMQAEVTATNDLASILTASSAVAKAQGDKQLARLNDSIPIMNDNHAIAQDIKDGNAQQLAMDKEQLLIDRTTAAMDQAVATFQIQIAEDGLKMAQDKMMVDQMNASAAYAVAVDNLTLAQDNVTLAEAQQQLGIDQLTVLNSIDTTLGSVTDYLNLIDGDLQNLQSAQDQIQTDQSNLAYDTSNQNITAQYGQGILAGDTVQSASDSAAMQQAQQTYEINIAQYKVQLASYSLQQKDSVAKGQDTAALQAMVKVLQGMVVNMNSPAGKAVRAAGIGANTLATLQNSFATTQTPMGFS